MQHKNTVFHGLVANIPWQRFDRLVAQHQADKGVRRLPTKSQFLALLYGQFAGATSLRDLVGGFASHGGRLYHLGARVVKRSSLAEANARRPSAVFSGLFAALLERVQPRLAREIGACVLLIDSTTLPLNRLSDAWARYSVGVHGAKLHVIYDPDADCPIYAAVTARHVNDITAAQAMPIQPGATYVFDLGYYDYAWWAQLDAAGCRIVTRLKVNTPLQIKTERMCQPGGPILSDRTGYLPSRQARSRRNPMNGRVREVRVRIESGKILRILSNDLQASAQQIADLYKRRWAIELFFRWIKQTLKIRHFLGSSENAMRIQIAVALIAFLLLRISQKTNPSTCTALLFARLVQANLMHQKTMPDILRPPDNKPGSDNKQAQFQWT